MWCTKHGMCGLQVSIMSLIYSLREIHQNKFEWYDIDGNDEITYKHWQSTYSATLEKLSTTLDEFVDLLTYSIDNLTTHSFIAKAQSRYLKKRKEEIEGNSCIVLMDFAENHHFVVQDEIYCYHWNKNQCTIHPVVIYYKDGITLKHIPLCII